MHDLEGAAAINIECDGRHQVDNAGRLRLQDRARAALIGRQGWKVIRFPAWRCLMEPKKVVVELQSMLSDVSSPAIVEPAARV